MTISRLVALEHQLRMTCRRYGHERTVDLQALSTRDLGGRRALGIVLDASGDRARFRRHRQPYLRRPAGPVHPHADAHARLTTVSSSGEEEKAVSHHPDKSPGNCDHNRHRHCFQFYGRISPSIIPAPLNGKRVRHRRFRPTSWKAAPAGARAALRWSTDAGATWLQGEGRSHARRPACASAPNRDPDRNLHYCTDFTPEIGSLPGSRSAPIGTPPRTNSMRDIRAL